MTQITSEENSLLNHRKEIRAARKELREIKKTLRDAGVDNEEEMEKDEEYKCAMYDINSTGNTMVEIEERIKSLKDELVQRENDYAAAKKRAEEEEQNNNSQLASADTEKNNKDEDEISVQESNDGSRGVGDDEVNQLLGEGEMDDDDLANSFLDGELT